MKVLPQIDSFKESTLFKRQNLMKIEEDLKTVEKTVHNRFNGVDGLPSMFDKTAGGLAEIYHFFTVVNDPKLEGKWWESNITPSAYLNKIIEKLKISGNVI